MPVSFVRFLSFLLFVLLVQSAQAATCTTKSSGGWSVPGRWDCAPGTSNGPPRNGDTAVVEHAMTLDVSTNTLAGLTVSAGNSIIDSGTNRAINLAGPLVNDGTITVVGGASGRLVLADHSEWSGSGTLNADYIDLGLYTLNFTLGATLLVNLTDANPLRNVNYGEFNTLGNSTATLHLSGTSTQTLGPGVLRVPNLRLSGSSKTIGSNPSLSLYGTLTVNAGATFNAATNNPAVYAYRDLVLNGSFLSGTGWWRFDGVVPQTISAAATFRKLLLNNPQGLTIGGNLTIGNASEGRLELTSGRLTTGANAVVVLRECQNGTWLGRSAGAWVNGQVQFTLPNYQTNCVYPIGDQNNYAPLTLAYSASGSPTGGRVTASTTAGDHPDTVAALSGLDAGKSVNRFWTLTPVSGTYTSFDVTLQYCALSGTADCAVSDVDAAATPTDFLVAEKVGSAWSTLTPSAPMSNSRNVSGLTGFGDFAIGELGMPAPIADYHFDECTYNGTNGEVTDSQGGYNATSSGGTRPTTAAGGIVGRYLNLGSLNQYVTTNSAVPLPGNNTVSFWTRFPLGALSGQRYYVAASLGRTSGTCRGDFLFFDSNNSYRWGVYSQSGGIMSGTTSVSGLTAGWHHFSVVARSGSSTLFIDGVQRDTIARTVNSGGAGYGLNYIGTSCDDPSAQAYRTPIDEFMVFNQALTTAQVQQIYTNQLAGRNYDGTTRAPVCNPGPHHFEIQHASGNGLTCAMQTLTVRACADATCSTLYTGGVSGSLSTSGAPTVAWDGTSGGAAGSGFVIAAGAGSVTKNVQVSTPGSVVFGVSGALPTTCTFGSPQCTFTSTDAGFVVASSATGGAYTIPAQVAGTSSGTLYLRALQASTTNPAVCTPAIAGQNNVAVNLGYACNDPTTCSSGNRLTVNTTPVAGSPNSTPTQNSTSVNLNFDANGSAPITLNYADVGGITLYASKTITPPNGTAVTLRGNSNAFVVKPFNFVLSAPLCQGSGANPGAADAQGGKFCPAGESFSLTVTALANGGTATPNYGKETSPEGVRLVPTLASDLGLTANPGVSGSFGSFSNGAASGSTFAWGEVGIITLQAGVGDSDYLGAGEVLGTASGNIGRFYPYAYTLDASALTNRPTACTAGVSTFTYIGEPDLRLDLTLSARNKQNGVAANYRSSATVANNFAKLSTGAQFNLAAVSGATKFSEGGRYAGFISSATADVAPTWASGTSALQIFTRLTRAASLEEYLPTFRPGIRPVDSDSVGLQAYSASAWGAAWDLDTDASVGNDHKAVGAVSGTELRSGRVRLQNANGSELLPLPIPLQIQFWSGATQGWQLNAADTCTVIQAANFAFAFPAGVGNNLAACETRMQIAGAAPSYTATLSAPGAGNNGWADLTLNLGAMAAGNQCTAVAAGVGPLATTAAAPWLQFPWKSASNENPTARATFGVYRSGPIIHRREMYR